MDANVAVSQFTGAAMVVLVIQWIKASPYFPWLSAEGQIVRKRFVAAIAAITVHTGIHFVWAPGTGEVWRQIVINLPTPWVMIVTVWHWFGQFAMQETIYQATSNKAIAVPTLPSAPKP